MSKSGEFPPDVVQLIWDRDKGCCAFPGCGLALDPDRRAEPFGGWSVQHREPRGMGGTKRNARPWVTRAANGVLLCGTGTTGHHGDVEANAGNVDPAWGFSVSSIGVRRPTEVPILHALYGLVCLTDDGGVVPVGAEPPF